MFVSLCVRLRVSPARINYKASGIKFCTVVQGRPGQKFSHFWELFTPKAQNRTNRRAASGHRIGMCGQPSVPFTDGRLLVCLFVVCLYGYGFLR